jgi:hypothetical protein
MIDQRASDNGSRQRGQCVDAQKACDSRKRQAKFLAGINGYKGPNHASAGGGNHQAGKHQPKLGRKTALSSQMDYYLPNKSYPPILT